MRPENRYQMMHFNDTVEGNSISMIQVSSQYIMKDMRVQNHSKVKIQVKLRLMKLKTNILWLSVHDTGRIHSITVTSST